MKELKRYLHKELGGVYCDDELRTVVMTLIREGLGLSEYAIYLNEPVRLDEKQRAWLDKAVSRLQRGEPLQYMLGTAPFAGFELKVEGHVLIPRPETAGLVELAIERLKSQHPDSSTSSQFHQTTVTGRQQVIDIGTGSGCIAIALAGMLGEDVEVTACDVSEDVLEVARFNARRAGVDVKFVLADMTDTAEAVRRLPHGCAGIVSNPPYIRQSERATMERRVTEWEPERALFVPDDDPLLFYRSLARLGQTDVLCSGGWMAVEINSSFAHETCTLFTLWGYVDVGISLDLYGLPRYVTCRKPKP